MFAFLHAKSQEEQKMKSKIRRFLLWIILSWFFLLSVIIHSACDWFDMRFGVSFEEILFTITSPLNGSDVSFLDEAVEYVISDILSILGPLLFFILICILLRYIFVQIHIAIGKFHFNFDLYLLYRNICIVSVLAFFIHSLVYSIKTLGIDEYLAYKSKQTMIYEDYYVDPNEVALSNAEKPQNLIFIYLESMETSYASKELGGNQEINYIPNLTSLAEDNISFSHNDVLGGASITTGATWTMGALFSTTTGVPFSLPAEGNSMNTFANFAPGITSLGDILEKQGYNQVFFCGSDGDFAGRKNYFEQHGNYNVIDYYALRDKGYIDEDYYVWWGIEDQKLYEFAKDELLELANGSKPFNFTMLTTDTHHVDGYICDICENTYPEQLANVIHCADVQIQNFIDWCKEQDFFENTTIVIVGDHLRMDSSLVADFEDRKIYNCFINSVKSPMSSTKNRSFTSLDFFPTTLSAMGFEIEGDRLGLGTDLFSSTSTLTEELGFDVLNTELAKYSAYYKNFE